MGEDYSDKDDSDGRYFSRNISNKDQSYYFILVKMEMEVGQAQVDIIFNFIIIFVFIPIIIFLITGGKGMVNKPAEERSWNK